MHAPGLSSLLGITARPFPWERTFILAAALIVTHIILFCVGQSLGCSSDEGFAVSFFRIGSPWEMLGYRS